MKLADMLAAGILVAAMLGVWVWSLSQTQIVAQPCEEDPLSPELYWD